MIFRRAESAEFEEIRNFYWKLIDSFDTAQYGPGWKKGVYPSDVDLKVALGTGELYVLDDGENIAAAAVINRNTGGADGTSLLSGDIPPERVFALHMLGVSPERQRAGVGRVLAGKCLELAQHLGALCVRLDVAEGNLPAEKLYLSMGFRFAGTRAEDYEGVGRMRFEIFEKIF